MRFTLFILKHVSKGCRSGKQVHSRILGELERKFAFHDDWVWSFLELPHKWSEMDQHFQLISSGIYSHTLRLNTGILITENEITKHN